MTRFLYTIWLIGALFTMGIYLEECRYEEENPSFVAVVVISVFWPMVLGAEVEAREREG